MSGSDQVLRVDGDVLRDTAPVFLRQSDDLRDAFHALHARLAALGTPWGHDEQGGDFHVQYGPAKENIDKAAWTLVDGLASIGSALKSMADNHDENELATKDLFDTAGTEKD